MNAGDTYIVPLPDTSVDSHLWVIISDPSQSDAVLIVNFTSWRGDKDQACVLDKGDHPYISRRTCVNFRQAKVCAAAQLDELARAGKMVHREPLRPEILQRIRDAVPESWISEDNAQMLVEQGLVELF